MRSKGFSSRSVCLKMGSNCVGCTGHKVRGPIRYGMQCSTTRQFVSTAALHLRRGFCTLVLINPRRACAEKVTVVVLCVCLFVCLSAIILGLQATRRLMSDTNIFSATRALKKMWRFC